MNKFDNHLDECSQCANHPFDLCEIGVKLLEETARELNLNPYYWRKSNNVLN